MMESNIQGRIASMDCKGISNHVQERIIFLENKIRESIYKTKTKVLANKTGLLKNEVRDLLSSMTSKKAIKKRNDITEEKVNSLSEAVSRIVCKEHEQLTEVKLKLDNLNDVSSSNYQIIREAHESFRGRDNYSNIIFNNPSEKIKEYLKKSECLENDIKIISENSGGNYEEMLSSLEIREKCLNEQLSRLDNLLMYDEEYINKRTKDIIELKEKRKLERENIKKEMVMLESKIKEALSFNNNQTHKIIKLGQFYKTKEHTNLKSDKKDDLKITLQNMLDKLKSGSEICSFSEMTTIPESISSKLLELDLILKEKDEIKFDTSVLTKQIDKQTKDISLLEERLKNFQFEKSKRIKNKIDSEEKKLKRLNETLLEIENVVKANKVLKDKLNIHSGVEEEYEKLKEAQKKIIYEKSKRNSSIDKPCLRQLDIDNESESSFSSDKESTTRTRNNNKKTSRNRKTKSRFFCRGPLSSELCSETIESQFKELKPSKVLKNVDYKKKKLNNGKNFLENELCNQTSQLEVGREDKGETYCLEANEPTLIEESLINVNSINEKISKNTNRQRLRPKRPNNESHVFGTPAKLRTLENRSKRNKISLGNNRFKENNSSTKSIDTGPEEYNVFVNNINKKPQISSSSKLENFSSNMNEKLTTEISTPMVKLNDSKAKQINQWNFSQKSNVLMFNLDDDGSTDSSLDDL
ncbi:Hypothetical protein SRAE_1000255300 [Strongyloides ratti]|uniref:Lebercilin domain-containing protein n=1 Tax=Strongyloides ratti TaxID=34506 RepID=A0A090L864_STRRB|nr:Hypothetical protein SRAE_1000255300 [Strongyloides ratti]CEF64298.1 Hypothetical protein SRAE_1000255300 [Strongyloides ratti]